MHLLDSYALNCGAKIDKPYIYTQYFPLGEQRYITIQPSSNFGGKDYDYWNEVIEYIWPTLEKNDIKIVQIGQKKDKPLIKCIWVQGRTKISQAAFVIKNSMLHAGVDSFAVHVASGFDKKIVALYSTNWSANCKPYWSQKEDYVILEPDRSERKPSFSFEDAPPKTINQIKPEEVGRAILKLLKLKGTIPYETVFIGKAYKSYSVHSVTNSFVDLSSYGGELNHLILRMDLGFDEGILTRQIENLSTCSIVTGKPISMDIISGFKDSIKEIVYVVDENHDSKFVKDIHETGIQYILVSELEDESLGKIKFDYLDYNFLFKKEDLKKEKQKILNTPTENLFYRSNKKILEKGKTYKSVAALKAKKPCSSISSTDLEPLIDSKEFWNDLEDFYIVKKLD